MKEEIKINDYFENKGITIVGKYFQYDKNIDNRSIENQIKLMVETQKVLLGYKNIPNKMFGSTIGKSVEGFKVQLKRLEKSYNTILYKTEKNDADRIIVSEGKIMLENGKKALKDIYDNNYLGVIERSMNRGEICIGRADQGNLRKVDGKIQIGVDKYMSYDLVEEDLYRYIKRLQRRKINIEISELIRLFVHTSHLPISSINYLNGLCSYPREFFKIWEKYIKNKKGKSIDEYITSLKDSLLYEK